MRECPTGGVADRITNPNGVRTGVSAQASPRSRSTACRVWRNGTEQWASSRMMRLSWAANPAKIGAVKRLRP